MEIPIELFLGGIGVSIALAIFGFIRQPQIPAMLVFGGMFILIFAVATDTIILGQSTNFIDSSVTRTVHYNVTSFSFETSMRVDGASTVSRITEFASSSSSQLVGDSANCISMYLRRVGTPTVGTVVEFGVWDSVGTQKHLFGTVDQVLVTTSANEFKRCSSTPYTIVSGDRIGARYNSGDAANNITVRLDAANPFDGTITFESTWNPNTLAWTSFTANDWTGTILLQESVTGETTTVNETYEFTELPKTLFALIGSIFMLCGALMVIRNN